jgi:hypothetical protein
VTTTKFVLIQAPALTVGEMLSELNWTVTPMPNWERRGEGVIIEGERIVAVCDTKEDAEKIIEAVNSVNEEEPKE